MGCWMGCWGLLGVAGMIVTSDDWDHSLIISPQKAETLLLWNVSVNGLHVFQPRYCLGGGEKYLEIPGLHQPTPRTRGFCWWIAMVTGLQLPEGS